MKKIVVRAPVAGLDYRVDPEFLASEAAADLVNFRLTASSLLKRTGKVLYGINLPLPAEVTHLDQFYKTNGAAWVVCLTKTGAYYLDEVNLQWVNVSRATPYNGDFFWSADIMLDTFVCANGVDAIQMWDGTGTFRDLPNTPFTCKVVRKFKNHLVCMHITELGNAYPQLVRWAVPGTLYDWVGAGSGEAELSGGVDWIVGAELLGDVLLIYKERSIVAMSYIGGTQVFRFDEAITGVGMVGPRAGVNMGDEHVFVAWDNIYVYGGGRSLQAMGDPIKQELYSVCTASAISKTIGAVLEEDDEFWFLVPCYGSEVPNVAWVYNYAINKWTRYDIEATCFGYYQSEGAKTFGGITTPFGQAVGRFGDRVLSSTIPSILLGDTVGNVYHYNKVALDDAGTPINAAFVTRKFLGEQQGDENVYKRWLKIVVEARGHYIRVEYRVDDSPSWYGAGSAVLGPEWRRTEFCIDVLGRSIQLRIVNDQPSSTLEVRSVELQYEPQGER